MPRSQWKSEQNSALKIQTVFSIMGLKISVPKVKPIESNNNSILYHASQSLPHTSSGYAIRTHGLISALNNHGINVETLLRYGYPLDRNDFKQNVIEPMEKVENVNYHFSHVNRRFLNN